MAKESVLQYKSSRWIDSEGHMVSACLVYDKVQIEVIVENPMRKHPVTNIVKLGIYKDIIHWLDEKLKEETLIITVHPLETKRFVVSFTPIEESGYYYTIHIEGELIDTKLCLHRGLYAIRKEPTLILNEPSESVLAGSVITFTGRLVNTETGEGIPSAKIYICDHDMVRSKLEASGTTGSDGTFCIEWHAKKMDLLDSIVETYAKFEGDDFYKASKSNLYKINVARSVEQRLSPLNHDAKTIEI